MTPNPRTQATIAAAPEHDADDWPAHDFHDRPRARRSEREIARLFDILDNLPPAREEMERMACRG